MFDIKCFEVVVGRIYKGKPHNIVHQDFQKAYNKISDKKTLNKIRTYGIRGNKLA